MRTRHAPIVQRKRRTRQHIIADLAVNHVERFILLRGHLVEVIRRDYGLDLLIFFHDSRGFLLDGHVSVQVKATDHPRYLHARKWISVQVDRRDIDSWASRLEPVLLVIYDVRADRAYWIYIQTVEQRPRSGRRGRATIRIPTSQRLDEDGIDRFAAYNAAVTRRLLAAVQHET